MIERNNPDIDLESVDKDIERTLEIYRNDTAPNTVDHTVQPAQQEDPTDILHRLYGLSDEQFAEQAHQLFTGHPAGTGEITKLRALLEAGWPRTQVAAALRYSEAGRHRPENAPYRLRRAWLTHSLCRIPLVGPAIETLLAIAGARRLKRTLIRLQTALQTCQAQLVDSHTQLHERTFELESQVSRLLLERQQLLSKLEITQANLVARCDELEQRLLQATQATQATEASNPLESPPGN
jgi:hypothetical protein